MISWELRIHPPVKHVPYGGPADSLLGLAPAHHSLVRMGVQHLTDSTFKKNPIRSVSKHSRRCLKNIASRTINKTIRTPGLPRTVSIVPSLCVCGFSEVNETLFEPCGLKVSAIFGVLPPSVSALDPSALADLPFLTGVCSSSDEVNVSTCSVCLDRALTAGFFLLVRLAPPLSPPLTYVHRI